MEAYRRPVVALPLSDTVKRKLLSHGFCGVGDLESRTSREVIDGAELSVLEAVEVLRAVTSNDILPNSAHQLLLAEQQPRIVTLCDDLDRLMEGGLQTGRLTEFCGGPGIGKTQLSMQLCVNAAIPKEFGGLAAHSVYIDTEGSFSVGRIREITQGMMTHLPQMPQRASLIQRAADMTVESVLSGIHYFRAKNVLQQLALFRTLPHFLRKHPEVRLVVVDSISVHFRQGFDDMGHRTRLLNQVAQDMMALAETKDVAVVFTNQVTKRFYENQESETVPVLGESWGQCVNTEVRLYWDASVRYAGVYKAPHLERRAVPYHITVDGIRAAETQ